MDTVIETAGAHEVEPELVRVTPQLQGEVRAWMRRHAEEHPDNATGLAEAAAQAFGIDYEAGPLDEDGGWIWEAAALASEAATEAATRAAEGDDEEGPVECIECGGNEATGGCLAGCPTYR